MSTVRTRFAPSPTGYLHIGGARTALFNYLYARHHGGTFVLRIEDTDRERSTQPSIDAILDAMTWLGLEWDEGPFYQTELVAVHREHVDRMLSAGNAYRCTCTAEELEAKRETARAAGRNPVYDRTCRDRKDVPAGIPFTVRLRAPIDGTTVVPDLIRGNVEFRNTELDDIILLRSDGTPTYNLGVVVDDALMRITHIIRGEDHLSNTPKQIQIYRALGFNEPKFAHIPLILGTDRARLSKRHGATSVMAYRDMGYLPDGLVNYLARLGWSHGDQEIFTRAELVEKFSLDSVGAAAGVYNPEKAEWVNGCHLKLMSPAALAEAIVPYITAAGLPLPERQPDLEMLVGLLRERANTFVEMVEAGRFFLGDGITLDPDAAGKHLLPAIHPPLQSLRDRLAALPEWSESTVQQAFIAVTEEFALKLGKVAQPVRVAMTGGTASPGIFEVLVLLGRERSLARLDHALAWVEERARNGSAT